MSFFRRSKPGVFGLACAAWIFLSAGVSFGEEGTFSRRTPTVIAVEKVGPAVVNIYTREAPRRAANPFRGFGDPLFDKFFGDFFGMAEAPDRRSLGSGVIINPEGYIVTNEHVISHASEIKVTLSDRREFDAKLVGADIRLDLAIVKIESREPLPHVTLGRSDDLMPGETVIAIGNPFGLQHTVTTGIVSALHRTVRASEDRSYHDFIQLDASINPGNSGGPLLNINGELIGINTAIYQKAEGIGFAIPVDKARRVVNELIRYGKVRRGWMGMSVRDISPAKEGAFVVQKTPGVVVTRVLKGGPADHAGVKPGDVLVSLNDQTIEDKSDYLDKLAGYVIESDVRLSYVSGGAKREGRLKATTMKPEEVAEFTRNWLGLAVADMDAQTRNRYRLPQVDGVLVTETFAGGAAGRIGIVAGDIIRQVNRARISGVKEFNQAILETGGERDSMVLLVQRGGHGYFVTLEF